MNNVLSGYNNQSLDEDFAPRGAFSVTIANVIHSYIFNAIQYYDNLLVMITGSTLNKWQVVLQFTTTEPFICLPPWINTNSNNQAGLVGVNNLSCNFNIDSTCSRVFSTANAFISGISLAATAEAMTIPSVATSADTLLGTQTVKVSTGVTAGTAIDAFLQSELCFNFLSLQQEQYKKLAQKNVCHIWIIQGT